MNTQLTTTEINTFRNMLRNYDPVQEALAALEEQDGRIEALFDQLWREKNGQLPDMPERKSLWQITLGSRSMTRFAQTADLLSVVQTLRRQGRSVIEFFQKALSQESEAEKSSPSLLPEPIP